MHKRTVIDFRELGKRYIFKNPIVELIAVEISQVGDVLEQVESYQAAGYYVVGYLSYESSSYFDKHLKTHCINLGKEYFAYFTVHSHVITDSIPISYQDFEMPENWKCLTSKETYESAFELIRQQIRSGNTYQVNYTVHLQQTLNISDSLSIYNRLVIEQDANYNAYVAHDEVAILSVSPELFFKVEGSKLVTRPMKGTTGRGKNIDEDKRQMAYLRSDPKIRSENMMIVDLLRNDMGKICQTGSIRVTELLKVEQYPTVWQLTSTIEGIIYKTTSLSDIFRALFPCGSITGAPKVSTMHIIHQLEKIPRGVYCGTIGLCVPNGTKIFNVAIRTIQIMRDSAYYGVGGGITWDSDWISEYREIEQKSLVLYKKKLTFDLITTARIKGRKITFLDKHIQRLRESAIFFSYPFNEKRLSYELQNICMSCNSKKDYRLKIQLSKNGEMHYHLAKLEKFPKDFLTAEIVYSSGNPENITFSYFKTSYTPHLSIGNQEKIYVNRKGQLLETSMGNIILELNGQRFTPPVKLGILNGIYRQHLIEMGRLKESILDVSMLEKADKIYACNAVRGMYEIKIGGKSEL